MDVSVIIPCYNHGRLIQEAIDSVLLCNDILYEIIIVNDGSTDDYTIAKIEELKDSGYKVISHENHGLGYTRNAGIKQAEGKYILPLDADNKIKPEYIYKAIKILDEDQTDIVYGNPIFFGENIATRKFQPIAFDPTRLFFGNYIDACAIYRKEVWLKIQGYDEKMPVQGHEDWEFWLNAHINGFRFRHLDEELYYYRILSDSMSIVNLSGDIDKKNYEHILKKHAAAFAKIIPILNTYSHIYIQDMNKPLRSVFKYLYRFLRKAPKI